QGQAARLPGLDPAAPLPADDADPRSGDHARQPGAPPGTGRAPALRRLNRSATNAASPCPAGQEYREVQVFSPYSTPARKASTLANPLGTVLPCTSLAARPSVSRPETASSRSPAANEMLPSERCRFGSASSPVTTPARQAARRPVLAPLSDCPAACCTARV